MEKESKERRELDDKQDNAADETVASHKKESLHNEGEHKKKEEHKKEHEKHTDADEHSHSRKHEDHDYHGSDKHHEHQHSHVKSTPFNEKEKMKKEYLYNSDDEEAISGKFWIFIGIIVILAIAGFAVKTFVMDADRASADRGLAAGDSVAVEFYVMSHCPYGYQAVNGIAPVLNELGDTIDFRMDYIARENDGEFTSLFGQPEVDENIRQLCAKEYNPDSYMDYVVCQNEDIRNAEVNFLSCAESAGIDVDSVIECAEGDEGKKLLSDSIKRADEAKATGSPTIFINGESYSGARDSSSFKKAICALVDSPACEGLPACSQDIDCAYTEGKIGICENPGTTDSYCSYQDPVKVYMVIVNDDECTTCDTEHVIAVSKDYFPGVEIEYVDVKSDQGKALVEAFDLVYVPSYIFTEEIEDTYTWKNHPDFQRSFMQVGKNYRIIDEAVGASVFIDEEKRKEQEERLNKYPEANLQVLGYNSDKPRLDYFVMPYCPYGNPADEAAKQLYEHFGDKVEIVPHYIVSVSNGQIQSLRGVQEGNQAARELCALEELGYDAFFSFVMKSNEMCTSENADTCWRTAAVAAGADADTIADCEADRKLDIAQQQSETINQLRTMYGDQLRTPSASPTYLINGKTYSGARDADSMKAALCELFDVKPAECGMTIAAAATPVPDAGNC